MKKMFQPAILLLAFTQVTLMSFAAFASSFPSISATARTGEGVYENLELAPNLCLEGAEKTTVLETPKIIYRFSTVTTQYGRVSVVAEMKIVKQIVALENLHPGSSFKNRIEASRFEDVCGKQYLSSIDEGSVISWTPDISGADLTRLPTFELVETGSTSRAEEFDTLINELILKTTGKTARWGGQSDSRGPIVPGYFETLHEAFDAFRTASLSKDVTALPVSAEAVSYPLPILLKMVK